MARQSCVAFAQLVAHKRPLLCCTPGGPRTPGPGALSRAACVLPVADLESRLLVQAVQSGKLSSREGARQLVAYLAMASRHREVGAAKAARQQAEAQLQQQQQQQQQQLQQQREKQQAELEHLQQLLQRQQLQEQQLQQSVSSGPTQEGRASGAAQQRSWLTEGIKIPGPGAVGEPLRNGVAPGLLHAHSRGDSFSGELSAETPPPLIARKSRHWPQALSLCRDHDSRGLKH